MDRKCIDGFYQLFNQSRPSIKWAKALEEAVLTFSDQQIITGIALLVSGYSQLRGGLAVYYWQLTVDLAWFSSITHLTTLTCLRYYFEGRRGLKFVRLILMAITLGMLTCALASTGYLGDMDFSYDYPAWCLFHPGLLRTTYGGEPTGEPWSGYYNTIYVVLAIIFLYVSYVARVIQLFPSGLDKMRRKGHEGLGNFARGRLLDYKTRASGSSLPTYWASVYTFALAIYCIFKAAADLYSSMLWEVCSTLQLPLDDTHTNCLNHKITWLAMALAWGTIRIITDRGINFAIQNSDPSTGTGQDISDAISEDNIWGFGQVVAVALVVLPLFSFFEAIYGKCGRPSNATCVWIVVNHTESVLRIESVIMDKKDSGPPLISAPDPIASPGPSDAEPWIHLYEYAWFRSLVLLIYLLSLATAANVLVWFPGGGGTSNLMLDIGIYIMYYLAWFGFDLGVLLLFTVICLSICHAQDTSDIRWTWRAETRPTRRLSGWMKPIQRILLVGSVILLAMSSAGLGFFTLLNP